MPPFFVDLPLPEAVFGAVGYHDGHWIVTAEAP